MIPETENLEEAKSVRPGLPVRTAQADLSRVDTLRRVHNVNSLVEWLIYYCIDLCVNGT